MSTHYVTPYTWWSATPKVNRFSTFSDKAKVLYAPREVFMPKGRPGMLDCHFRANPPLTSLRWDKDGFLFDPYNVKGVYYRRNGSLYFKEVSSIKFRKLCEAKKLFAPLIF